MRITCLACKATEDLGRDGDGYPYRPAQDLESANKTIDEQNRVITLLDEKLEELGHDVVFGK